MHKACASPLRLYEGHKPAVKMEKTVKLCINEDFYLIYTEFSIRDSVILRPINESQSFFASKIGKTAKLCKLNVRYAAK